MATTTKKTTSAKTTKATESKSAKTTTTNKASKTATKASTEKPAPIKPSKPKATLEKEKQKATSKKADGTDGNKKIYHISKRDNDGREWKIFIQGSEKVIKICKTQEEALKVAKTFAKNDGNATIMLHGLDGKIRKF